jgi:hypothetical protein
VQIVAIARVRDDGVGDLHAARHGVDATLGQNVGRFCERAVTIVTFELKIPDRRRRKRRE